MDIVSLVANLVKEKDYYKEAFDECRAIITQLTEGPGKIEYIHPNDLHEMLNDPKSNQIIDIWKFNSGKVDIITVPKTGKEYKQSAYIPAKRSSTT